MNDETKEKSDLLAAIYSRTDYWVPFWSEGRDYNGIKIAIIVRVEPSESPKDQQQHGSGGPQSPKKHTDSPPLAEPSTAPKQVTTAGPGHDPMSLNSLIDTVMVTEI